MHFHCPLLVTDFGLFLETDFLFSPLGIDVGVENSFSGGDFLFGVEGGVIFLLDM